MGQLGKLAGIIEAGFRKLALFLSLLTTLSLSISLSLLVMEERIILDIFKICNLKAKKLKNIKSNLYYLPKSVSTVSQFRMDLRCDHKMLLLLLVRRPLSSGRSS